MLAEEFSDSGPVVHFSKLELVHFDLAENTFDELQRSVVRNQPNASNTLCRQPYRSSTGWCAIQMFWFRPVARWFCGAYAQRRKDTVCVSVLANNASFRSRCTQFTRSSCSWLHCALGFGFGSYNDVEWACGHSYEQSRGWTLHEQRNSGQSR